MAPFPPRTTFAVLVAALAVVNDAVSGVYFPRPTTNITLPDLSGLQPPLPPLLKLQTLQSGEAEVKYAMKTTSSDSAFRVWRDEVLFMEDRLLPRPHGQDTLTVYGRGGGGGGSAVVNVMFTDGRLTCDALRREMCFWGEGKFRIRKGQEPAALGYLSSEFLLSLCTNYSVAYHVVLGGKYFAADRIRNTNADSWVLSLVRTLTAEGTLRGEISCSITADGGPATVFRSRFEVEVVEEDLPRPSVSHRAAKSDLIRKIADGETSIPRGLEIMSLVVPDGVEKEKVSPKYPESVEISKFAAFASRVAEPAATPAAEEEGSAKRSRSLRRIVDSKMRFRIEPDQVLGVTEVGGIVYVLNPQLLRNSTSFRVKVTWSYPKGFSAGSFLLVNVSNADGNVCGGKASDLKNRKSCSQKTSEGDCTRTCGVSTGLLSRNATGHAVGSGCQWRDNEKPEVLSVSYRTCSPDLSTCPDRFCDPLEKLFPEVCPQDCAVYVYGSANKEISAPGISSASGVCSCGSNGEARSCTCDLLDSKKRQAANSEQCGMACLSSVVGGSVIVIFGLSTFLMILYHRRLKKRCPNQGPLKEDMININYEEYIDRSADGLRVPPHNPVLHDKPDYYDKKWEFPRYRLTVEETIGEGEFGKVLKARAEGIGGIDGPTIVAVKTLKENAKESELTDLVSEYQLLKEVDHPNIIHLLGACTTLDGPLYIIIEYAKYGSLRNYLRRNRHFGSELQLSGKESETSYMQTITPKDILTFAWQIAKGMAYLTEMKLVHRDLAARNVLVAEGLICKISDFGLTRDIYEDDTYLKRSKGRVPVKWMALESLSDHLYTTKSDVWSYGIVLWELVTTGASPYPGIAVQNLFHLLKSGYRMEKPVNCSTELYQILRSCWHENPSHRPTFKCLVSKLEEMLGEGKDYLDLNPRIIENKTYFSDFPCDAGEEEESFLENGSGERKVFRWKFDFTDSTAGVCECPEGECSCRQRLRYENELVTRKPKYENEGVQDSSYVQPKGEPKPVNSSTDNSDLELLKSVDVSDGFSSANLYNVSNSKKMCEVKKI